MFADCANLTPHPVCLWGATPRPPTEASPRERGMTKRREGPVADWLRGPLALCLDPATGGCAGSYPPQNGRGSLRLAGNVWCAVAASAGGY